MGKKNLPRLSTFDLKVWLPASIVSAVAFYLLFYTNDDAPIAGRIFKSLLWGGAAFGIAVSWLASMCWNIGIALLNRKSGSVLDAVQCGAGYHEWTGWRYVAKGRCEQRRNCPICGEEEEQVAHDMGDFHYVCVATLAGMPEHTGRFETLLSDRFSQSDIREFCFKSKIDPENLEGDSKIENIQSLIAWHNKKREIGTLIDALKNYRADISDDLERIFPTNLKRSTSSTADICELHAHCARCGHIEEETGHLYSEWSKGSDDNCDFTRICERCDEEDSKTEHKWSAPQYINAISCRQEKICIVCGAKESEGVEHQYVEHQEQTPGGRTVKVKICSRCGDRF
ncbi:MAG: hypothetical protein JNJ90_17215 [Saprospiraceae bacterium]|jgi:hypothetical protein|nr:hypothetical protein [Saprospiraceae bacterium]